MTEEYQPSIFEKVIPVLDEWRQVYLKIQQLRTKPTTPLPKKNFKHSTSRSPKSKEGCRVTPWQARYLSKFMHHPINFKTYCMVKRLALIIN